MDRDTVRSGVGTKVEAGEFQGWDKSRGNGRGSGRTGVGQTGTGVEPRAVIGTKERQKQVQWLEQVQ